MTKLPLLQLARAETDKAREQIAGEVFAIDAARMTISKAAGQGFGAVSIRPPRAIDLHDTAAAVALVKYLTDGGFIVSWGDFYADREGVREMGRELVISWEIPDLHPAAGGTSPALDEGL